MNSSTQLLVISAHAADFVWRAGGAIATVTQSGGTAKVIALSYGERGESGELWKEADQTEEKVKAIRRAEGEEAAAILGANFEGMDLGDYPLELDRAAMERLTAAIREFEPTVILTHAKEDPFNPDHGVAYAATEKARQLASGAGVASALVYLEYRQSTLRASNVVDALCGQSCNHFPLCDCGDPRLTMCGNCRNRVFCFGASGRRNHGDERIRSVEKVLGGRRVFG